MIITDSIITELIVHYFKLIDKADIIFSHILFGEEIDRQTILDNIQQQEWYLKKLKEESANKRLYGENIIFYNSSTTFLKHKFNFDTIDEELENLKDLIKEYDKILEKKLSIFPYKKKSCNAENEK